MPNQETVIHLINPPCENVFYLLRAIFIKLRHRTVNTGAVCVSSLPRAQAGHDECLVSAATASNCRRNLNTKSVYKRYIPARFE